MAPRGDTEADQATVIGGREPDKGWFRRRDRREGYRGDESGERDAVLFLGSGQGVRVADQAWLEMTLLEAISREAPRGGGRPSRARSGAPRG